VDLGSHEPAALMSGVGSVIRRRGEWREYQSLTGKSQQDTRRHDGGCLRTISSFVRGSPAFKVVLKGCCYGNVNRRALRSQKCAWHQEEFALSRHKLATRDDACRHNLYPSPGRDGSQPHSCPAACVRFAATCIGLANGKMQGVAPSPAHAGIRAMTISSTFRTCVINHAAAARSGRSSIV
jgi:hypothetical protein